MCTWCFVVFQFDLRMLEVVVDTVIQFERALNFNQKCKYCWMNALLCRVSTGLPWSKLQETMWLCEQQCTMWSILWKMPVQTGLSWHPVWSRSAIVIVCNVGCDEFFFKLQPNPYLKLSKVTWNFSPIWSYHGTISVYLIHKNLINFLLTFIVYHFVVNFARP
jgi:hypothetical protein